MTAGDDFWTKGPPKFADPALGGYTPLTPPKPLGQPVIESVGGPAARDAYTGETDAQKIRRLEARVAKLTEERDDIKAGRDSGETSTVRALYDGIPDPVRSGVKVGEPIEPLAGLGVGRNFSPERIALLEEEVKEEYYEDVLDGNGRVVGTRLKEELYTDVDDAETRAKHDAILRADDVVDQYSGMTADDKKAMLADLRARGDDESAALATALEGNGSTAIATARKDYFYAQAKASDNAAVQVAYGKTAAQHYAALHGTDAIAGVPFDATTITALEAGTPEARALAVALKNPTNEGDIATAMANYIGADPGVIAAARALPRDRSDPSYAKKLAEYRAAQEVAIARSQSDSDIAAVFNSNPTDLYTGIHGQEAVAGEIYPPAFYETLRAEGTPEAIALAIALEEHRGEGEIQTAMDDYAYSLGATEADVERAKDKLYCAEHLPQLLDRALDNRNQALLDRMGLENFQFTDEEKALGALNVGLKGLKGIGVLANFGKGLLDTAAGLISSWEAVFGTKKPEEFITKTEVNTEAFALTEAGSSVADKAKEKAKPPEEADGSKTYDDKVKAAKERKEAFATAIEKITGGDRDERTVASHKAMEGYKSIV